MKILFEAFDSTMPANIRNWMKQFAGTRPAKMLNRRADFVKDFDPATAEFQDVSHISVSTLRDRLKEGTDVIFAEVRDSSFGSPTTVAIYYDPSNSTNKLKLVGNSADKFKEKSFKWIIENATSVYAVPVSSNVTDKRADRKAARKGLVYRDGDSAKDSDGHWSFTGQDWKKDASGYWYDANRLANKLAKMHEDDAGYYYKRAANIFTTMANMFADKIKEMAQDKDNLDFSTFGEGGFEKVTREGQRLLRSVGEKMQRLKDDTHVYMATIEDINKERLANGAEELDAEKFEDGKDYLLSTIKRNFIDLNSYFSEFKSLIK